MQPSLPTYKFEPELYEFPHIVKPKGKGILTASPSPKELKGDVLVACLTRLPLLLIDEYP